MKVRVMAMISNMGDGGAQKLLLNQLESYKNDDDIHFTVFSYESPIGSTYDKIISEEKLDVVYLNKARHSIKIPIIGDVINFFITNYYWYRAIKNYKPDVINTHVTEILRKSMFGIYFSGVRNVYCTLHSNPYRYKGTSGFAAKFAFNVLGFTPICITEDQASKAKDQYHIKNYQIVRNGIDSKSIQKMIITKNQARQQFKLNDDDYVITAVGRLNPIKNLDILISITKQALTRNAKTKLLLVGDGPERQHLEQLVKDYQLADYVIFSGNIKNVVPVYCAADVLCMPSISEASPMALHEAQCCGLRCIISDGVPTENIFSNNVIVMKKGASVDEWVSAVFENTEFFVPSHVLRDFDIEYSRKTLKKIYMQCIGDKL